MQEAGRGRVSREAPADRYELALVDGRWTIADHAFEPPSLIVYGDEAEARRDAERFRRLGERRP